MRSAMKAVAANLVPRVAIVRESVKVSAGRQGLMKSRIKHGDVGGVRQQPPGGKVTLQVVGIVQRGQVAQTLNSRTTVSSIRTD